MRSSYSMPSRLHRGDRLAARLELLLAEHLARVVEGRLQDAEHVERVRRLRGVEQLERGERERRQRLVEREVRLQLDREADAGAAVESAALLLDHAGVAQRAVDADRPPGELALPRRRLVVVEDEVAHDREALAGRSPARPPRAPIRLMSIAAVSCIELVSVSGCAAIRRSKLPSPQLTNPSGAFFFTSLRLAFGSIARLGGAAGVLDLVLGRLGDDVAGGVVPGAAGPPGDLVELAGAQLPHP